MRVAGIGCRAGAALPALQALLARAGGAAGLDRIATLAARAPEVAPLAHALGLPLDLLAEAQLRGVATPTQSPRIAARFGTGSVAEAVALLAAGANARIMTARIAAPDGQATLAIAEGNGA